MQAAASGLRRLGVAPSVILTSPLPRAAETADIVAAGLHGAPAPRQLPALGPDVPAVQTLRALRLFARHRALMVVGHQPSLGQLVALLLTGSADGVALDLKKGGCAALESTGLVPGGGAALRWLVTPRMLRRVG
jgi:phosphohistidine phosphatase